MYLGWSSISITSSTSRSIQGTPCDCWTDGISLVQVLRCTKYNSVLLFAKILMQQLSVVVASCWALIAQCNHPSSNLSCKIACKLHVTVLSRKKWSLTEDKNKPEKNISFVKVVFLKERNYFYLIGAKLCAKCFLCYCCSSWICNSKTFIYRPIWQSFLSKINRDWPLLTLLV